MVKQNVLFLCSQNSARSQMAEAFLRHYAGDRFEALSAGLQSTGVNPYTIRVMEEIGIDMSTHTSKSVKVYMGRGFYQYIITVCSQADKDCPQALWAHSGKKMHWAFEDPASAEGDEEQIIARFREIRDQIDAKIKEWLSELETA